MTQQEIQNILDYIKYKDWNFISGEKEGVLFLQLSWMEKDNYSDEVMEQKSRKWMLSEWMTKSEIVQTALKAVLTAEEHEIRERFKYKGVCVFNPHFDVDVLVEIVKAKRFDYRTEGEL